MGILFRFFELWIYAPLIILPIVAWRMNLYWCALLMGRSFFAFLISIWLYSPLGRLAALVFNMPPAHCNAAIFLLLWFTVWLLVPFVIRKLVQPLSRNMKFAWSEPGKIISGLVAGWFVVHSLIAFLVMLPKVEGAYMANETAPLFRADRRSARLYSSFTFTPPVALRPAQMEAAAEWIRQRVQTGDLEFLPEVESLPLYFDRRYRNPWPTPRMDARREELRQKIERLLDAENSTEADHN